MARKTGLLRPYGGSTSALARVADCICIAVAHVLVVGVYERAEWHTTHTAATLLAVLGYLFIGELTGLYQTWRGVPIPKEIVRVWGTWLPVLPMLLGIAFLLKVSEGFSRLATIGWFVVAPLTI